MLNKIKDHRFHRNLKRYIGLTRKVFRSMKFRIFIILLLIGIVPIIIFQGVVRIPIENAMVDMKMDRLLSQCNILKNHIISENYMEIKESPAIDAELSQLSAMYDGRIMLIDNNFMIIKDTYVMDEDKTTVSEEIIKCYKGKNVSYYDSKKQYIKFISSISKDNNNISGIMYVTFSTKDVEYAIDKIAEKMYIIQTILALVVVIFAFFWTKKLVKPFDEIGNSFEKVSFGYFDNELSLSGYTETEKLAQAFNSMLGRMKKIDDSRQEFVSNVSHELKTPITSIKVLADSLMMQDDVPNEIYKEFFGDIVNEIDRENEIITDLLTLVRLDKKNASLNISQVNINELVEMILKRLKPIAAKNNIELVLESFRPILAEVDEVKMTSAISNLVENAIKYNVMDGWVRVTLNADHKYFFIKVADSGIGIPDESQEMVFERFYRVDKTRARKTGGTGLGLAITKNVIMLHNGAIKVYSKEGEGTTFTVRIPLNYVNEENR